MLNASFSSQKCQSSLYRSFGPGVLLMLGMSLLVKPAEAQSDRDPAAVVGMTNTLAFTPDTVQVQVGQTVRWENTSVVVHTVTADPDKATLKGSVHLPDGASAFDSGTLDPEETFEYTFEVPGRYRYFCIPHEATKMIGTVIVKPADGG